MPPLPSAKALRRSGSPPASRPCLVRSHSERLAPASRNLAESVPADASLSQSSATVCSSGAQSHAAPPREQTPGPNCVIFPAVQAASGNARISSTISAVFPMLRVCPPTTRIREWTVWVMSEPALYFLTSGRLSCAQPAPPSKILDRLLPPPPSLPTTPTP